MILSSALEAYLKRPLESHRWVKALTDAELDEALSRLKPRPRLNPRLRRHQKACFLLGVSYPQFCFWLDMGVGKSILSLELLRYWFESKAITRAIIFVTSDKAFTTWERQFKEFDIDIPVTALAGSSADKWSQLEAFSEGIVLVPYPGAVAMVCSRVKGKRKVEFKLDKKKVARLALWANAYVLDESTRAGNHRSLTHKMIAQLKKHAQIRYALAGRPFGRDPTLLWGQSYLIDSGETLGETLGLFRAAFFDEKKNHWAASEYVKDYKFRAAMKPQLARMAEHRSVTYSAGECIDLPKLVPIREVLKLPEEAQAYYRAAIEDVKAARGNLREMKNVFLRMRQISSGFIGLKDDETGARVSIELLENPKLERLLELIEDLPEGSKGVVFHDYNYSAKVISEALTKQKIGWMRLWSGTKDPRKEQKSFSEDPKCEIAIINNRLGAMSIDGLQMVANYTFFYETPVGVIDREQAERRLFRQGQRKPVMQYDLVVKGTVDERILEYHAEGKDFFDAVLRKPQLLLGG